MNKNNNLRLEAKIFIYMYPKKVYLKKVVGEKYVYYHKGIILNYGKN